MLKKQVESEEIYIFPEAKSSRIRNLLKMGRLKKGDWTEEEDEEDEEKEGEKDGKKDVSH